MTDITTADDGASENDAVMRDRMAALPKAGSAVEVRERLLDLMRRDLVGPHPDFDADLEREILDGTGPSTWYLTGFLAPRRKDSRERRAAAVFGSDDEQAEVQLDALRANEGMEQGAPGKGAAVDDDASERPPMRSFVPSSLGLTVLVPSDTKSISARVTWGDYVTEPPLDDAVVLPEARERAEEAGETPKAPPKSALHWRRLPREEWVTIDITRGRGQAFPIILPNSAAPQIPGGGLQLVVTARPVRLPGIDNLGRDALAVSVFLVNARPEALRRFGDLACCFQARLELNHDGGFLSRHDHASYEAADFDERLADLHYRDVCSYAVGHNTSGDWHAADEDGHVKCVFTNPIPCQSVEKLTADLDKGGVERGMEALDTASASVEGLSAALSGLPTAYATWAAAQQDTIAEVAGEKRREVARRCLDDIRTACARIKSGIDRLLTDATSREAFAIMNRVMARANRQRGATLNGKTPAEQRAPSWRLFQLAFILLNLDGLVEAKHDDRAIVDLLFFPTGGGKTEAYLGLAAFAIARRRLDNPGLDGAGLSVVMRYTLRLLTLDQLQRAAGLICALELERKADSRLGTWPIEIGLWVGSGATPNSLGTAKNNHKGTAVFKVAEYRAGRGPAPAPMKNCPWCGSAFTKSSFHLHPTTTAPQRLDIRCDGDNTSCAFWGERLPVVVVDDDIYRRLPAFMIATVDKFANVPWSGEAGGFFGHVERHDATGFYSAAVRGGQRLPHPLPPIDLIIQDELHLISGPLGTIAGLYETAFDLLASRTINGLRRGPKIVASTATVRRAEAQIRGLFGREKTAIFPPPGISRHDSFFAEADTKSPSRLYAGIASPGRGPKLVFLRTLQTLLAGGKAQATGGESDPADPYMSALCYFNALRELGGARRIVDDEVRAHLTSYGRTRTRLVPEGQPFADRQLREIQELTSRYSTDQVSEARTRLGYPASDKNAVDVAMATNMISVGLDIGRLGLMVVQGQPKTAAEYIQATSRVGREGHKPGLVVTLLNIHKPRDRTHYEQFRAFHMSFYRAVEATSVTPFSPRALDRALAATLVAAARHVEPDLSPNDAPDRLAGHDQAYAAVRAIISEKMAIAKLEPDMAARCLERLDALREAWIDIANTQTQNGGGFVYANGEPVKRLLQEPFGQRGNMSDNRAWFVAARSMRDTEPVALLKLRRPDGKVFE